MNLTRKIYTTRREKTIDFIIGIVILHIVNIVMTLGSIGLTYLLVQVPFDNSLRQTVIPVLTLVCQCLPWLVNLGMLVLFGVTRYWIALGALATIAFYFLLAICAAVVFAVVCFVQLAKPGY